MDAAERKGFVNHGTPVVCKPSFKVLLMAPVCRHVISSSVGHTEHGAL